MNASVFLDTVGLLALWNRRDQWHEAAKSAFTKLTESRCNLVTTSFVLLECGNAAAKHPFRNTVFALRQQLAVSGNLLDPTYEELHQAWTAYASGEADRQVSWITCHSLSCVARR